MKKFHLGKALLVAAAMLGPMTASASMITYETRAINAGFATDYKAGWEAQTSAITLSTPSAFDGQTPGFNSFSRLTVNFDLSSASTIIFQLGLDAGLGSEIRMDGTLADRKTGDIWWNGNWGNTTNILNSSSLLLGAGNHAFTGYWAEGCCAGGQAGRFSIDNGQTWSLLSTSHLDALAVTAVPEPGMLALLGIGLAGVSFSRRKKAAK